MEITGYETNTLRRIPQTLRDDLLTFNPRSERKVKDCLKIMVVAIWRTSKFEVLRLLKM
jgi:hypothetical protein